MVDARAMTGFAGAEDYERGRPGYANAAVSLLIDELMLDADSVVLDLAAGTGQVSRSLRDRVGELIAVEPAAEMRAEFAARHPDVTVLDGTAETIPLPDDRVDAVFVGEAFHWFDVPVTAHEIARVLCPHGGLALLWNVPLWTQRDTPWLSTLQKLLAGYKSAAGRYPSGDGDWQGLLDSTSLFEPLRRAEADHVQRLAPADFVAQVASWSWVRNLHQDVRDAVLEDVHGLVNDRAEIVIPYRTEAYWTGLR